MLTCDDCTAVSTGSAWHWIAILRRVPGGAETVCYCPLCAESKLQYFSRRRTRRLELSEDVFGD
jgi:hypothetical protein